MTLVRSALTLVQGGLKDPLLRNGYALVLNVGLTSVLGVGFWIVAAREYSVEDVGRGSAMVSALILLSTLGQLNMTAGLLRFLPTAGRRAAGLVARTYAVTGLFSVLLAAAFLLIAPEVEGGLTLLPREPLPVLGFCAAVLVWTVFALQDSATTGLRRATWIPLENSAYGVLKLVLLVPFAFLAPGVGVFAAWVLAAAVILPPMNVALFRRWLPAHARLPVPEGHLVHRFRDLRRFLALDYVGSVCSLASTTALPLLVVSELGTEANGRFYVAWTISSCLDLISLNLAQSLTVESSLAPARLSAHLRALLPRMAVLQAGSTAVLVIGAPLLLSLYGGGYAADAASVVRLLTLAVLPRAVIVISIAVARVERRVERVLAIQASSAVGVLGLSLLLVNHWGIAGVGAAWLATQTVLAGVLLPRLVRLARAGVPAPAVRPAAAPVEPLDRPGTARDRSTSDRP
jgi:O-antigen/teichoic acid export membrane protein